MGLCCFAAAKQEAPTAFQDRNHSSRVPGRSCRLGQVAGVIGTEMLLIQGGLGDWKEQEPCLQ